MASSVGNDTVVLFSDIQKARVSKELASSTLVDGNERKSTDVIIPAYAALIFHQYLWLTKQRQAAMDELGYAVNAIQDSNNAFTNLFVEISKATDKDILDLEVIQCMEALRLAAEKELVHYEAYDSN